MRVDVHQHIWTAPLLTRLGARQTLPLVRHSNGLTVLHSAAEQPYVIDVAREAAEQRAALVRSDGLDLALIAISSPIGIEALPRESALELIDAHLEGVGALPGEFAAWGPVALDGADADQVDRLLARGCVGISLPAGALVGTGPSLTCRTDSRADRRTSRSAVRASWSVAKAVACRRVVWRAALVARADRLRRANAGSLVHVCVVWAPRTPRAQRHLYDARWRRAAAERTPREPRRARDRSARSADPSMKPRATVPPRSR